MDKFKIGFIGQGWVGKNYADNFVSRGFDVTRYSVEKEYIDNKYKIKDCDIVFVCVPTPTTPNGFDLSIVEDVIKLVGDGKIAVIKSTIMLGSTEKIQKLNPNIFVMHSPEFLTEITAAYDVANPERNIIGLPVISELYKQKASDVMSVLVKAPYEIICGAKEAELIKYGGNCWFYVKVIFMNLLYEIAEKVGCNWNDIRNSMAADNRIGGTHLDPVHKNGRGAGGHCFPKDLAAFIQMYRYIVGDEKGLNVLTANVNKNIDLLLNSKKDLDILTEIYGNHIVKEIKNDH